MLIDCRYGFKTGLSWLRAVLTFKEVASSAWLHVPVFYSLLVLLDMLQSSCWSSWEENQKKDQLLGLTVNKLVPLQESCRSLWLGWGEDRVASLVSTKVFDYNHLKLIKSRNRWWYSCGITLDNWTSRQQFTKSSQLNCWGLISLML